MLGVLVSLVLVGSGLAAVASMVVTVRAQARSVAQLLRDSRSIAKDREFLVRITGTTNGPSPFAPSAMVRLRRLPHRAVRLPATAPSPQREAA